MRSKEGKLLVQVVFMIAVFKCAAAARRGGLFRRPTMYLRLFVAVFKVCKLIKLLESFRRHSRELCGIPTVFSVRLPSRLPLDLIDFTLISMRPCV